MDVKKTFLTLTSIGLIVSVLSGCTAPSSENSSARDQITTIEEALDALNQSSEPNNKIPLGETPIPSGTETPSSSDSNNNLGSITLVPSNPTIADYIKFADFTQSAEQLFLGTDPRAVGKDDLKSLCTGGNITATSNVLGCFVTPPSRILIYDIPDDRLSDAEAVIAAHEMLHAVWYLDLNQSKRDSLTKELKSYYDSLPADHFLRDRLSLYAESPESIPTELHSILGTEAQSLTPSLEAHYLNYFNNRQRVVNLANNSFRYIDALKTRTQDMSNALATEKAAIEVTRAELRNKNTILNNDIETFNNKVDNGEYTSKGEYNKDKEALESRQKALSLEYSLFEQKTSAYNTLVKEYNELVALNNSLNEALKTS